MCDFVVIGTDTDAGKTTFALLWLSAFGNRQAYWKPVETGESDTERIRQLVPNVTVYEPIARFAEPIAPALAARRARTVIPSAATIVDRRPRSPLPLLIETFGGPLSPLNDAELQIKLIRRLSAPAVLVTTSMIGAIGRALAGLFVLRSEGLDVRAVVLLGPGDDYANDEIRRRGDVPVISLQLPDSWDEPGLAAAVQRQQSSLEQLQQVLAGSVVKHAIPSDDLIRRDRLHIWHPYTSLRDAADPLPVLAARDEFLTLTDGRRVIDGISSWWTILHGHRHPRLIRALQRAADEIDHVLFAGVTHPYAVDVGEGLLKTVRWAGGRVFFSDNGSTAVEVALKMAYQFWCQRGEPQRTVFVGFDGAYHGDTFGAMSIGRDPIFFGRFEPFLFRAERVALSPDQLDATLTRLGSAVAAVIVEPLVQGAGGMRTHSPETLRELFEVARRHDVLFIADEVMTCGRTGTFWAHAQAGIVPDLICAAKTLAGGVLPLAVTLAASEVVAAFDDDDPSKTFFHGHSFTAHPLACAVATENLHFMAEGHWQFEADRIRRFWDATAQSLRERTGVRDVRVCGTILALDVGETSGYLADVGRRLRSTCLERGILLRPLGNVLYALPPLCTSDDSLGRIAEAMRAAVGTLGS
jgi:adenosylmethionine-8-amino-7-oxononanoate aminotransferase